MVPPRVAEGERGSEIRVNGHGSFSVSDIAHGQLAEWAGIPKRYYDLMLAEAPELHAVNVNHWLKEKPARRMLRTLDGSARAFLSDRYRVIDNEEVLESILPAIAEIGDIRVESAEVTERRLYLKCLFPKVEAEVAKGDIVQAGFVQSNSEIGLGSVSVDQLIFRLVCTNGMIRADSRLKNYHVGRIMGFGFGTIVYLAALTDIDPAFYEAAVVDGATRGQQTLYITLPGIAGTIIMLTKLSLGSILNAGFDQIFNLYSPLVYRTGDIIDTLVYRTGILNNQYGVATAVGLLKSLVSLLLIGIAYKLAAKWADYRIF